MKKAIIILGILVTISLGLNIVVLANTIISSNAVSYTNSKTNESTVNGALNELFSAVDINGRLGTTDISNIGDGTVSSAISTLNTNLSGKQATITGGASTITSSNLTANKALISNGSGKVAVSGVTSTELGYLSGTTSNVQTQLNNINTNLSNKQNTLINTSSYTTTTSSPTLISAVSCTWQRSGRIVVVNISFTVSTAFNSTYSAPVSIAHLPNMPTLSTENFTSVSDLDGKYFGTVSLNTNGWIGAYGSFSKGYYYGRIVYITD